MNGQILAEDVMILYVCRECDEEHYFELRSLPGGDEHCAYCEHCSGELILGVI